MLLNIETDASTDIVRTEWRLNAQKWNSLWGAKELTKARSPKASLIPWFQLTCGSARMSRHSSRLRGFSSSEEDGVHAGVSAGESTGTDPQWWEEEEEEEEEGVCGGVSTGTDGQQPFCSVNTLASVVFPLETENQTIQRLKRCSSIIIQFTLSSNIARQKAKHSIINDRYDMSFLPLGVAQSVWISPSSIAIAC